MVTEKIGRKQTAKIMLLIQVCFFLSGLSGLIYEILWTRMIIKIIGSAPFAVSIVLTVFMGGLGLGSYLASRTIDRIKKPIKLVRLYGTLEIVIGAYGLVLPVLLVAFRPLYAVLYNRLFSYFMTYNLLTFIGCSALLCVPVICMGATLPILCRFYVTKLSHLGSHAGRLYGLNTIGAAIGALLCGFWLISLLGVWGTLIFAVLINCSIGLSCLLVGHGDRAKDVEYPAAFASREDTSEEYEMSEYPGAVNGALVIFAVSGFCAMAYEVIWTKLLGLIIAPTTYSFTIVLVTFILGLALGSMIFGWLADRTKKVIWLLISTQIGAALLALGTSQLLGNSQLFFAKLLFSFQGQFALLSILKAVTLFAFMILPTLCLGATFPLVGKIYTRSISKVGRSIGVAYTINTIGAVLGSFCAGFVLIPLFGKENSLSLVIGLQLLTSLVVTGIILIKKKKGVLRWVSLSVPALAGLFLCLYFPMWNRYLLAKGRYHRFGKIQEDLRSVGWLGTFLHGSEIVARSERYELVYYGDGIGGFTTVLKFVDALGNLGYMMVNSGKPDASSRGDMRTQTLLAHFPMLFHRNAKTVMVLGLASGITAGEVLYYPIERLDVIDINQQVVEASSFFIPWNNNVLFNPKTNLIIQDGRAHLQLTRQKYDVIISEPPNPWMAGIAALFTRDFFTLAEDRLNENGIFVQFIHSYQMDWPTFALVGRTFAQVFPNSLLLSADPDNTSGDYLLVGFKSENQLILENAEKNLAYAQKSKNITLSDSRLLCRLVVSEDLQKLFGQGPVNTDNWPLLEFAAPRLIYTKDLRTAKNIQSKRWVSPATEDIVQQLTTNVDAQIDFAAYAFSIYTPFHDMVDLSRATPSQKERFFKLMDQYFANNVVDPDILKNDELERRCYSIQIEAIKSKIDRIPDKAFSYSYLAFLYDEKGMLDEAIDTCFKSLEIDPSAYYVYNTLVGALLAKGEYDEAIKYLTKSLEIKPNNADAHSNLGAVYVRQGRFDKALVQFAEALRIKPDLIDAHYNLGYCLHRQGRYEEAVREYLVVLKAYPNNPHVYNNMGLALTEQGKFGKAILCFKEALRIKPDYAAAQENLKYALARESELEGGNMYFPEQAQPGR